MQITDVTGSEMRFDRKHVLRSRRGLTLLECLVASTLLALGSSAVMVAISSGIQQQQYAGEQRVATELAVQLLEQVCARSYLDDDNPSYASLEASSAQGLNGYADTVDSKGEAATGAAAFSRSLTVTGASAAGISGVTGVGVATAQVTTPAGETVRLSRLLPAE